MSNSGLKSLETEMDILRLLFSFFYPEFTNASD